MITDVHWPRLLPYAASMLPPSHAGDVARQNALTADIRALRGIRLVTAATIMVEAGDLGRFESARQFMGYLGLVPGERSTGEQVRRGGITKDGIFRRAWPEASTLRGA